MASPIPPRPLFIDGAAGSLFAVLFAPSHPISGSAQPAILYLPPFGEEMNRSRRTIALLGQHLAEMGVALLALDLFGTGDSAGELELASWADWESDAGAAIDFLRRRDYDVIATIGLRSGAALALTAVRMSGCGHAVLWQPIVDGRRAVTDLLRSRALAATRAGRPQETIAHLRERLLVGQALDISGYRIAAPLMAGLEAIDLPALCKNVEGVVDWFDITADPIDDDPLNDARRRPWDGISLGSSVTLRGHTVTDTLFWRLEESPPAGQLVAATVALWEKSVLATAP